MLHTETWHLDGNRQSLAGQGLLFTLFSGRFSDLSGDRGGAADGTCVKPWASHAVLRQLAKNLILGRENITIWQRFASVKQHFSQTEKLFSATAVGTQRMSPVDLTRPKEVAESFACHAPIALHYSDFQKMPLLWILLHFKLILTELEDPEGACITIYHIHQLSATSGL